MEYCQNGDLQKYIDKMRQENKIINENNFFDFAAQIASGLSLIHGRKIIHRDLKPANIFLSGQGRLKIGDFGLSKVIDEKDYAHTVAGTRSYLSPEILNKWSYTEKVDMWSFGICLYILAELTHPFDTKNEISLVTSIVQQQPAPFVNLKNQVAQNLIISLLSKDSAKRPNADDILQIPEIAIQH
ncbi:MAG: putative NEK protein kinase [Streblomastix strix]|uniref:non-specific serine/threonine protein kinase n=1 Tax=Streblomastix strix TaxID=222440 RepID=A0A5J4V2V7_9EUKA|nr:MAG: putative NEK protein kinase [Streblomastix strix]